MKTSKKGLQKFTETEKKVNHLLAKKKIYKNEILQLTFDERVAFYQDLTRRINQSKGEERDDLLEKVDEIISKDLKNQLWENNHYEITVAITKLMEDYGKMPTKNLIAEATGLSRQTIYKHLKDYAMHPLYAEEMKKFRLMSDRVLAKVYKYAMNGEVKAARLYFEVLGYLGNQSMINAKINTQNNYIQINGMILNQETIKHLNPEQLNGIEAILKAALLESEIQIIKS